MSDNGQKICICPSCKSRYQVNAGIEGKSVSCRKCGVCFVVQSIVKAAWSEELKFGEIAIREGLVRYEDIKLALKKQKERFAETNSVVPIGEILVEMGILKKADQELILARQRELKEQRDKKDSNLKEREAVSGDTIHGEDFDVVITEDRLNVYLLPREESLSHLSSDVIKAFLIDHGVKYGIIDDANISGYLKSETTGGMALRVARGKTPVDGKNGRIKYHFEAGHRKTGKLMESGGMDFRDRGGIAYMHKGDLIAEGIQGEYGAPGLDVFGLSVSPASPELPVIRCGSGAEPSKDGMLAFATIDGRPEISVDGKLYVFPELKIDGDVGIETGHIDFDGSIEVNGAIQDGFHVKGGRLSAHEVLRGEIDVASDVVIQGGIIGAKIKANGMVKALYVRESQIEAIGDVLVEREIVDSRIITSGSCIAKQGKIISSIISAKKGIEALEIGSETSKGCALVVGIDERIRDEVDSLKLKVETNKKKLERCYNIPVEKIRLRHNKTQNKIGELVSLQDRTTQKKQKLIKGIVELVKSGAREHLAQAKSIMDKLDKSIRGISPVIEKLFEQEAKLVNKIKELEDKAEAYKKEVEQLYADIEALCAWSVQEASIPVVKVYGTIFAETSIKSIHSSLTLVDNDQHVNLTEVRKALEGGKTEWVIMALPLK
ncbi:MAG: FapA family protein [Pseudomonadota bacterium]